MFGSLQPVQPVLVFLLDLVSRKIGILSSTFSPVWFKTCFSMFESLQLVQPMLVLLLDLVSCKIGILSSTFSPAQCKTCFPMFQSLQLVQPMLECQRDIVTALHSHGFACTNFIAFSSYVFILVLSWVIPTKHLSWQL